MKRLLFITKNFPPATGGQEEVAYNLYQGFKKYFEIDLISAKKGRFNAYLFLFGLLFKVPIKLLAKKYDAIYLNDLSVLNSSLTWRWLFKKTVIATAHGLDVIYKNPIYRFFQELGAKNANYIVCVSNFTQKLLKTKFPSVKTVVISNGVDPNKFKTEKSKSQLINIIEKRYRIPLRKKRIIISVGHLVRRKGFHWFVDKVVPRLSKNVLYLIIGGFGHKSKGDEKKLIISKIRKHKLEKQVFLLGRIPFKDLKALFNIADLFVMPNLDLKDDVEGFGIVAIEASSIGLPVIATSVQGITDAVKDGKNGFLVKCQNSEDFFKIINKLLRSKEIKKLRAGFKEYTIKHYHWDKICRRYVALLNSS